MSFVTQIVEISNDYTVLEGNEIIFVDTTTKSINVTMFSINSSDYNLTIIDSKYNSSTYSINIFPSGTDKLNNGSSLTINSNGGCINFKSVIIGTFKNWNKVSSENMPIAIPSGTILQVVSSKLSSDITTSSSSLSDLLSLSITIQAGSKLNLQSSFSTSTSSILGSANTIVLDIDGAVELGCTQTLPALSGATQGSGFSHIKTGLTSGSHTLKLRWSTSSGTARCRPVSDPNNEHASIIIMEIK